VRVRWDVLVQAGEVAALLADRQAAVVEESWNGARLGGAQARAVLAAAVRTPARLDGPSLEAMRAGVDSAEWDPATHA
jgi:hypothetical protein